MTITKDNTVTITKDNAVTRLKNWSGSTNTYMYYAEAYNIIPPQTRHIPAHDGGTRGGMTDVDIGGRGDWDDHVTIDE